MVHKSIDEIFSFSAIKCFVRVNFTVAIKYFKWHDTFTYRDLLISYLMFPSKTLLDELTYLYCNDKTFLKRLSNLLTIFKQVFLALNKIWLHNTCSDTHIVHWQAVYLNGTSNCTFMVYPYAHYNLLVHRLRIGSTFDIDAINVLDVIALQGESRYRAASLIGTICR